ncbi:MAG: nitroreductase [Phycisphaerales bacterium]|nr:nitroreductase [Phycisphaerales bacterium]
MPPLSAESVLSPLRWRYATKQFDATKKITDADFAALAESLRLSPSSFGLQPWKFYVVTTQSIKEELFPLAWKQNQIKDCSHLIVLTARRRLDPAYVDHFVDTIVQTRGTPIEKLKGLHDMLLGFAEANPEKLAWAANQVYIALGFLMQTAAMMGIDACPMEGIDKTAFDRVLKVDPDYTMVVACPVGYRVADDRFATMPKVRFCNEELFVNL